MKMGIKNNKGYTLVEIIIVVAIIAILAVAAFTTLALVYRSNASGAANEFASILASAKVATTSGKNDVALTLTRNPTTENYVATLTSNGNVLNTEVISDGPILISYTDGSVTDKAIDTSTTLTITFDKDTGAFTSPVGLSSVDFKGGGKLYSLRTVFQTGYVELV